MWIPALGCVLGYGFFYNCAIAPHISHATIDWTNLIMAFSIVIGLGGARDVILRKYTYLGEVTSKAPKNLLTNKVWIPFIGWCLVLGFANNIALVPICSKVSEVDWNGLMASLSILLTISGARDYGIYAQKRRQSPSKSDELTSTDDEA